jgi:antitoxin CcdA
MPNLRWRIPTTGRRRQRDAWLNENRAAIDAYSEAVEKHGTFSDTLRRF